MEDYDNFVQRRLSHLRRSEEEEERHRRPSPAISLICIHGRPILPPLLSGEQREEMQRHRDVAQKAAGRKKLKDDPRMSYVQTILNSVPLSTPTLEELLRETEIDIKSSCSQNTSGGSASESHLLIETTMDSLSLSPPLVRKREDGLSPPPPPLASIVSSAFLIYNVTPQESYNEGCLADQHDGQQGPQPSSPNGGIPKSVSSGYATCENTVFVPPAMIDAGSRSCGLGSSEGTYSWDDFFLQSTSHTITKMPEIISHPAVDGEALERGLELSLCNNFTAEQDMCCTSFQDDSATSDNSATEASESSHRVASTESCDNIQSTGKHDLDRDHISDRNENPENSGFSDNPELSDTLSTRCNSAAQLLTKHEPTEPAGRSVDEATPSEDPYRMSLQALLKKSQEYRQQQWMLRNQAKNTKVQKRNQEPNRRTEEQSLSDKENDESPCKVTVTPDGKNTGMIESEFTGKITDVKSESKHLTGDSNTKEVTRVEEEETVHKNNKLNSSQEVLIELEEISSIIEHQPVATEVSPVQEAFNLPIEQSNLCLGDIFQGVGRIYTIPAPNFCTSPGEPVNGAESSEKMHEDQSVEHERNRGHQNTHTAVPSTVNLMVPGDVTGASAKSSDHINRFESNLSILKVLISDMELTGNENLENHSQTKSNTGSEISFEGVEHSEQSRNDQHVQLCLNDCDFFEEKLRGDDIESSDLEYRDLPKRLSIENSKNLQEAIRSEPVSEAVNLKEIRLIKTLVAERVKQKGMAKEGLTTRYGLHGSSRRLLPPATCDSSTTEPSESSRLESTESGDNIPSTGKHDLDRDHISDRNENPENSGFSDNPELSDTLSTRCNSAAQLLTKHEPTEPAGRSVDEATPSEDPYRMSLQALLKKSQEYRQQQWMLRNQAKNTKVQKRNQELNRRTEEQSLSDKENDESPCKVTVTPDGKNTGMIESEFTGKITDVKSESKHLTGDSNTKEVTRVEEEETIHKNNKLNSSQEVLIELEEISSIIEHQPVATEVSPVQEAFNLPIEQSNLCLGDVFQGVGRIYTIPAPNFCTSPVPSKSRVTIENGEPVNGAESSEKMHEGQSFEHERNRGHQNTHTAVPCERAKQTGTAKEGLASRYGWHGSSRRLPPPAKCIWAAAQRMRIPDVFRNIPSEIVVPCNAAVLSDTSNHPAERSNEVSLEGHDSSQLPSLNQSYDVDTPSELWLLDGSGSDSGSNGDLFQGNLTPESTDEGQGRLSKVKRRLLMHTTEETQGRSADTDRGGGHVVRLSCSTPRAAALRCEGLGSQKKQEQLKRVYTAQIRALRDEHRRQQEELQQALAARYSLLQSVSFSCSPSASRLGDTMTFSTLSQPSSSLSVRYCHLLSAAVKGYLARRLLRTERVAQLVRTIRDTQQFLFAFQLQNPNRGDLLGRQDLLLQKRVALQLRAARYEVYDIFFILSARERMQLISWDRNLTRERALRQQSGGTVPARRKSFLSAATEKALERKKGVVAPKKAVERHSEVRKKTGHRNGFSTKQPREAKRGQFRANPLRVPKSAYSTRPR